MYHVRWNVAPKLALGEPFVEQHGRRREPRVLELSHGSDAFGLWRHHDGEGRSHGLNWGRGGVTVEGAWAASRGRVTPAYERDGTMQ